MEAIIVQMRIIFSPEHTWTWNDESVVFIMQNCRFCWHNVFSDFAYFAKLKIFRTATMNNCCELLINYSWKFIANIKMWRREEIKQDPERLKCDLKAANKKNFKPPLSCTLKFNFSFVNSFHTNCSKATERSAFVFTLHIFHAFKQSRWKITRSRLKASWFFWSLTYGNKKGEKGNSHGASPFIVVSFLSEKRDKKRNRKENASQGVLPGVFDQRMLLYYDFSDYREASPEEQRRCCNKDIKV